MAEEPRFLLRLYFGAGRQFGPGKARLLALIEAEGSISAAGRGMGMSYKRAWSLVEQMNADFAEPLVDSTRGGPRGGGARLTGTGREILAAYGRLEAQVRSAGGAEIAAIEARLKP
ncbi:winged helix-turn-helix domain-containing protein [Frigidibacter sp. MR17.24]|uniref:winged helix-turn-helix domain-containing protein n=1 Tax=Frigidibacter sp. MR17.24 TaxID=3127345 RepID=UPI0030130D17